jgi:hypothetical protein
VLETCRAASCPAKKFEKRLSLDHYGANRVGTHSSFSSGHGVCARHQTKASPRQALGSGSRSSRQSRRAAQSTVQPCCGSQRGRHTNQASRCNQGLASSAVGMLLKAGTPNFKHGTTFALFSVSNPLTSSDTPAHYSLPTTFTATRPWPIPRPLCTAKAPPSCCCASPSTCSLLALTGRLCSRILIPRRRHPCRRFLSGYSRPHRLLAASSLCARALPHHNNASPLRSPAKHTHPILDSSLRALL